MASTLPFAQPARQPTRLLNRPSFWLALLALLLLGALESRFIAWCWPAYGEAACSRYSLPLNFLLDLAFFVVVVLVFDRRWWIVLLAGVLAVVVYHAGSLGKLVQGAPGGESLAQTAFSLAGWTIMALYLALLRVVLPALILHWLARIYGGLTRRCSLLFGVTMVACAALYKIVIFGGAALLSPGSVAQGYIFTPLDLAGALLAGLAGWLAAVIGSKLREKQGYMEF